jgi:preprotein translocase subunit SecD
MPRRNNLVFFIPLIIFVLAALVIFPINEGILGGRGVRLGLDLQGGIHLLNNRINPLGVTEPLIQIQGNDRIALELPGLTITDKEKERLSRVAILEFGELAGENETAKWMNELGSWKPATAVVDGEETQLTSRYFEENTFVNRDNLGRILLTFEWNEEGSEISQVVTSRLLGQPLAIFEGDTALRGEDGRPIAPIVEAVITDRGVISGLSFNEVTSLSQQLNAGRLPVPLEIIFDETVSPILGSDFVDMSLRAGLIGILVVMAFMIFYYRLSGLLASLALVFYGALVMALFKLIPVTLTLAGLGGFILSIGMAVDANVLIFERMKEEFREGRTLGAAIDAGFSRAWSAIRDSNITTIIVCLILIWLASSIVASAPVQGFAVTLLIGIVVSMFTAIIVTRTLLRLFVGTSLARRTRLFSPYTGKRND